MKVVVTYLAPSKQFSIISQQGSKTILNHVFPKLLQSEKEAATGKTRAGAALTSENYAFRWLGSDAIDGNSVYVLAVTPKRKDKFLVNGTIWVDVVDFAVVRVRGHPARNPSFWISDVTIEQDYRKVGEFWLPSRNRSTSKVRLGGRAMLQIEYHDYEITAVQ